MGKSDILEVMGILRMERRPNKTWIEKVKDDF